MPAVCGHGSNGLYWFRILGYGLHWKDVSRHPLLFSERYGYTKFIRLGKWIIRPLLGWKAN